MHMCIPKAFTFHTSAANRFFSGWCGFSLYVCRSSYVTCWVVGFIIFYIGHYHFTIFIHNLKFVILLYIIIHPVKWWDYDAIDSQGSQQQRSMEGQVGVNRSVCRMVWFLESGSSSLSHSLDINMNFPFNSCCVTHINQICRGVMLCSGYLLNSGTDSEVNWDKNFRWVFFIKISAWRSLAVFCWPPVP